jgi:peptidyl-tRNA hydrolase
MTPAMYLFLNKGLGMSTGKAAAQVAHAAVEAYRISMNADSPARHGEKRPQPHLPSTALYETNVVRRWYCGGHYMKLVMEARDSDHLRAIETYLEARGFRTVLIIDEGRTEVEHLTLTALGVEIVDKDDPHVQATFGDFKLYRDPPPPTKGVLRVFSRNGNGKGYRG